MREWRYNFKKFRKEYAREAWIFFIAAFLSILSDLIYKNIEVAETTAVGTFIIGTSEFLFTLFIMLFLFHIITKVFFKRSLYQILNDVRYNEPPIKEEPRAKTSSRKVKR